MAPSKTVALFFDARVLRVRTGPTLVVLPVVFFDKVLDLVGEENLSTASFQDFVDRLLEPVPVFECSAQEVCKILRRSVNGAGSRLSVANLFLGSSRKNVGNPFA